jgi:hypothetical protein
MFSRRTILAALLTATALVSAVEAQVKLTRKVPEGKRAHVTTQHTDQKLTIAGQEIPTVVDVVNTESYTYQKAEADGTTRVAVKNEGMVFTLKLMGNVVGQYDSAKPDATKVDIPQLQPTFDGFKAINGKTRTMVFDKDGKLKVIEGVDAILAGAPAEARANLEKGYSKEAHEKGAKIDRDRLPNRELKKGDKWQVVETSDIGGGQTFTFDMFYEYQGTIEKDGRTLDKISIYAGTVKYAMEADPMAPFKVVNSDLKIESSTGMMYFDREKGEVVEVSNSVRITGPMTFSINNMELPGKLDLVLDNQTVVK